MKRPGKKIEQNEMGSETFLGYVVGIGASAGGLEALERFFSTCPYDSGLAFVVVQHLSPDHKSMMADLLSRYTKMPIHLVEHGMLIRANCVYLIPAGTLMRIVNHHFQLTPKSPHIFTLPIDIFLNSLSENYHAHAIGVILSGTGSDGTRGAYAINDEGGFLLAQEPASAKFDGMPNSVIATGLVDEILPAEALAARIIAHTINPQKKVALPIAAINERPFDEDSALEMIFQRLAQSGGVDFHDYKMATVSRRLERRMQVKRIANVQDYALLLEEDSVEVANLRRELFIPVTSFFRDTLAFAELSKVAVHNIVLKVPAGETIRVWSAGVATGEEVYSIAMLFMEAFEQEKRWPNLKIFATDANPLILEMAAAGQYPESIAAELTPERLERFFYKTGSSFTIKPELRQCVVFARHNLLVDPPFTRMDLVSCRNTLIYFKAEAQVKALHRLQYATKAEGYLFLGSSESLGGMNKSFTTLSNKYKLFQRNQASLPFVLEANIGENSLYLPQVVKRNKSNLRTRVLNDISLIDESTASLLKAYAPPSILVNERHEVIHIFGDLQSYLKLREGSASLDINRVLPEVLVSVVSALLYKAFKDKTTLYSDMVTLKANDQSQRTLRLCVRPVHIESDDRYALVVFEEQMSKSAIDFKVVDIDAQTSERIEVLQLALAATRESLQATIEELETSNEELQATNEELMASNEELQSSNEELQSVNEEMNTVNAEFQEKVLRLNQANADLDSMAKAVGVATIFVDPQLQITRFTADVVGLFKLRDTDIGRPLSDIRHTLHDTDLTHYFETTLKTGRVFEQEVSSENGHTYLLRILPYHVPSSHLPGAVATFTDVSAIQDKLRLQAILNALPEHLAVLAHDGSIAMVNEAWRRFAKANGDPLLLHSAEGSNYLEACQILDESAQTSSNKGDDNSDLVSAQKAYFGVKGVLEGRLAFFSHKYPCHSPTEKRWFVMNVAPILGQYEYGVVVSHNNITAWVDE
ncbi:chemotaxis protein CheB [Thiomicrorhabdus aquaedulcis]|uniref:chemotaxis protein CheB n=1 Tax=Thiomicrorhabdus aquaedulcis TaxID=2211106 RepID=UPI001562E79C|nr:chemotaxis protein CheB [Thiomicrorhabdus aquaedulcis]